MNLPKMTPEKLRELYDREETQWTDDELIAVLTSRYEPTKVPPCRVCGAALSIGSIGGGEPTVWACTASNGAHYGESRWIDRRQGGDSVVMELIARHARQNGPVSNAAGEMPRQPLT